MKDRMIRYNPEEGRCDSSGFYCKNCPLSRRNYGRHCMIILVTQMLKEINNDNHK